MQHHIHGKPRLDLHPRLGAALQAAAAAGEIIARGYLDADVEAKRKGIGDFFSRVDTDAERAAVAILQAEDPTASIVAEESTGVLGVPKPNQWVVDPLDGSVGFLQHAGVDIPSALISYRGMNGVEMVVMYLPLVDRWFYAVKSSGAYLNNERISPLKHVPLANAWVDLNQYGDSAYESEVFARLRLRLRQKDGAALVTTLPPHSGIVGKILTRGMKGGQDIAAVVHDNNAKKVKQAPWDAEVPQLLIQEAGGVCLNFAGERYDPWKPEPFLIAGSRELAMEIIERSAFIR